MSALWLAPDEPDEQPDEQPENQPVDSSDAYGDPAEADTAIQMDRPIGRRPAPILAIWDDEVGFAEIPTRLTP